jgi:hypothetical protein
MLAKGLIRESSSSAASPVLFVPKAGGELRLCVDFRQLNMLTRKDRYPIPSTDMLLDQLSRAKLYTKLDLRAAYHCLRVAKGDEWKMAFRTRYGLFEYLVMPFSLTNAPAAFQGLVNIVLRQFIDRFIIVYLNNILIYSEDPAKHDGHVRQVLDVLRANALYAKPEIQGITRGRQLGPKEDRDHPEVDAANHAQAAAWLPGLLQVLSPIRRGLFGSMYSSLRLTKEKRSLELEQRLPTYV